jgi:hypothetical protein
LRAASEILEANQVELVVRVVTKVRLSGRLWSGIR